MPYCTKCGAFLEETSSFCTYCGTPAGFGSRVPESKSLQWSPRAPETESVSPNSRLRGSLRQRQVAPSEGDSHAGTIGMFFGAMAVAVGFINPISGFSLSIVSLIFGGTATSRREPNAGWAIALAFIAIVVCALGWQLMPLYLELGL